MAGDLQSLWDAYRRTHANKDEWYPSTTMIVPAQVEAPDRLTEILQAIRSLDEAIRQMLNFLTRPSPPPDDPKSLAVANAVSKHRDD